MTLRVKCSFCVSVFSITFGSWLFFAHAEDKSPFRVVGLEVKARAKLDGETSGSALMGPPEGTAISAVYTHTKPGLLELDRQTSKLESFTDSSGNDILGKRPFRGAFSMQNRISKDKRKLLFRVETGQLPAKGSTGVRAKGRLAVKVATTKARAQKKNARLTKGGKLEIGPFELRVASAGKAEFFEGQYAIQLESKHDLTAITKMRFLDSKGKEIAATDGGSGRMSFNQDTTWTQTYRFDKALKRASIEIEYYKDIETIRIPFDISAGVGL